jgi:endoglucanase
MFITADNFRSSGFRGFNLSVVPDLASLKAKNIPAARLTGANHGRYWLQVNHDAGSYTYYFCNYKGIKIADPLPTLDEALKIAEANGFYLILTLEVLPKQGKDDWWGDTKRKAAITKVWTDLAARYKDRQIIAAYDLMNEPRKNPSKTCTTKEYIDFQISMIKAIRAVDVNHVIAVEVLSNQMLADPYMSTIAPIKNLVYSPHGYSPLSITHQGVSGTTRKIYPATSGTYVANYFKNVSYWNDPAVFAKKYNVPIWVGEFACINWAPKNNQGEYTATRWTKDAIAYMESLGWSYAGHAWREWIGWDVEIPGSWYEGKTFTSAAPSSYPGTSVRSANAPTLLVYKEAFKKNNKFYNP